MDCLNRDNAENQINNNASFRKRYLFKLLTNIIGLAVGLISQSIIPRALGPASYGNFSFLTSFFQQLIGFLNLNSSTAFYAKLSQRPNDKSLIAFYFRFLLLLGTVLGLFLLVSYLTKQNQLIWPNQTWPFVVMGAVWAFLTFFLTIVSEMSDAFGITVKAEVTKLFIKLSGLAVILCMFLQQLFSLLYFFIYHFIFLILSIILISINIQRSGHNIFDNFSLSHDQLKVHINEFLTYCSPLVVFSVISVTEGVLDRWLLQRFSGSIEQGFFGLAYQTGTICFLFTSAMVPLLMREYVISFSKGDLDQIKKLFLRFVPMLYVIAAYFSCFLAVEAKHVVLILGGIAYQDAIIPISIMCLYPIHQTYGQVNGSVFLAASRTIAYRNIGIYLSCFSLPITILLLGPQEYGALQLGAVGLAGKMVIMQFIGVNIQLWYNAKLIRFSFTNLLRHQLLVLFIFVPIALFSSYCARTLLHEFHFIIQFLFSGTVYSVAILSIILFYPTICSLTKEDVTKIKHCIGMK